MPVEIVAPVPLEIITPEADLSWGSEWSAETTYPIEAVVSLGGVLYVNKATTSTGQSPTAGFPWEVFTDPVSPSVVERSRAIGQETLLSERIEEVAATVPRITASPTPPEDPQIGDLWINTSS